METKELLIHLYFSLMNACRSALYATMKGQNPYRGIYESISVIGRELTDFVHKYIAEYDKEYLDSILGKDSSAIDNSRVYDSFLPELPIEVVVKGIGSCMLHVSYEGKTIEVYYDNLEIGEDEEGIWFCASYRKQLTNNKVFIRKFFARSTRELMEMVRQGSIESRKDFAACVEGDEGKDT